MTTPDQPTTADPMPVFVLKGQDALAPGIVDAYRRECLRHGLVEQSAQVNLAFREMAAWQARHPERVKLPDHQHVPAQPDPGRKHDAPTELYEAAAHAAWQAPGAQATFLQDEYVRVVAGLDHFRAMVDAIAEVLTPGSVT